LGIVVANTTFGEVGSLRAIFVQNLRRKIACGGGCGFIGDLSVFGVFRGGNLW
jgi:hypothetical protein